MPERRWVSDTNTLVSRLSMPGSTAARAVDHALALRVPLVSEDTLAELAEVLVLPRFDRYVSLADRQRFTALLALDPFHGVRILKPAALLGIG